MLVFHMSCGQNQTNVPGDNIKSETKDSITSHGPSHLVRAIIQDRKGNIWMASWEGIIRYDGKSFTNITSKVTSARFFSVLEDRKGNFWFASVGSGVYYYDGKSFQHFTTKEGLLSNSVLSICEDKKGNIWSSSRVGKDFVLLRYDVNSLSNKNPTETIIKRAGANNAFMGILEAFDGSIWVGSGSGVYRYDGNTFTDFKSAAGQQ